ncbi:MAG TPA: response regulator [Nitrososphaera sp.]|jgi:DNA-binding response OmpR family regulator|nr:response regulator [Nitrososphaera sp.]
MLIDKQRILVVDDEKDILHIVTKGLELKGYDVDGFTDPTEAIQQFKPSKYDAVITDIRMPILNGFDLYRLIRKQDDKVKVFFMTAFDIYENEAKLVFPNLAPNSFIKKPTTIDKLVQLLEGPPSVTAT